VFPVPGIPSSFYLTNSGTAGNVNYRIPLAFRSYVEPTAGIVYVRTFYDQAMLGFTHGEVVRLQAGARMGTLLSWYGVNVLASLKTLAYSNVEVVGPALQTAALGIGPSFTTSTDQGKLRGDVEGSLNFLFGAGYSALVAGSVRFGSEYMAAGGKLGVRKEW
jgi:hypothetical protein